MVCERTHPTHSSRTPRSPRRRRAAGRPLPATVVAGAAAAALLGAAVLAARRIHRLEVHGDSMLPTFQPGDRLVAVEGLQVRPGDVVALADPRESGRLLVKRVSRVHGGLVEVRGDNDSASTDSRAFGPVDHSAIRGRVVYRYAPPEKVGPPPY